MARFFYVAVSPKGRTERGDIEAEDKDHAAAQLQARGLFLTFLRSYEPEKTPGIPGYEPRHFREFDSAAALDRARILLRRYGVRTRLEVAAIVALAVVYLGFGHRPLHIPTPAVQRKIDTIHPGMTRRQVEAAFNRYMNGHSSSQTRYLEAKQVMVDVPYDRQGGEWSPENRVVGEPRVYTHFTMIRGCIVPRDDVN